MARDVHDVLGHSLTALSVKAELAARLIDIDPARAKQELESIQTTARQALAEVRATVGGLRAGNLEAELAAAPLVLADAGITTTVEGSVADTDPRHRALLAWVLREAVTNVVRHAQARSVVIQLGSGGIAVTDDGCRLRRRRGQRPARDARARHRRRRHPQRRPGRSRHPGGGGAAVIRLLLADDQALVRGALAALLDLESDLEVVAQVGRGDEVVDAARASGAEVCLLDIEMPGLNGIDAAAAVRRELPGVRSLVVTTFGRPGYVRRAIEAGASGFVVKDTPARQLADAVRRVHAGLRVIDPDLAAESLIDGPSPLTGRERELLTHALDGSPVSTIAARVHLSEGTVRNHLSAAIGKTGATTRSEAARIAQERGWL